jgi:hypothetical protein
MSSSRQRGVNFRSVVGACVFSAGAAISQTQAQAAGLWDDFYLSYRYVPDNVQPGTDNGHAVPESALNLSYANAWAYGSNFFSLDLEGFSKNDPSVSVAGSPNLGSSEFYGVFRTTLSGNKISGTKDFAFGPFSDVGLRLGGDYDVQNDSFGSYKRLLVAGPQFDIAVPKGYWFVALELSHEWDTNGYIDPGPATSFDATWYIESAWLFPFDLGPVPLDFTGYLDVIGPKGRGYVGGPETGVEVLFHPKLLVDVTKLAHLPLPGRLMAGVGYEFWYNKFGNQAQYYAGTKESSAFLEVGYHF